MASKVKPFPHQQSRHGLHYKPSNSFPGRQRGAIKSGIFKIILSSKWWQEGMKGSNRKVDPPKASPSLALRCDQGAVTTSRSAFCHCARWSLSTLAVSTCDHGTRFWCEAVSGGTGDDGEGSYQKSMACQMPSDRLVGIEKGAEPKASWILRPTRVPSISISAAFPGLA